MQRQASACACSNALEFRGEQRCWNTLDVGMQHIDIKKTKNGHLNGKGVREDGTHKRMLGCKFASRKYVLKPLSRGAGKFEMRTFVLRRRRQSNLKYGQRLQGESPQIFISCSDNS